MFFIKTLLPLLLSLYLADIKNVVGSKVGKNHASTLLLPCIR